MSNIGHKAILASAGSGKTFQLAHRYIRILADRDADGRVVSPDRICAMTFTRKAAGEIFDNIAKYLLEAAEDSNGGLDRANENLGGLTLTKTEYLSLLRRFIDNLHKARIGTFDSFLIGIAKAFPVELGIPMSFQVMDTGGSAAMENRRNVLDHILNSPASSKVGKTFLDAFKMATIGIEEKKLGMLLDSYLTKMEMQYRLCPDGSRWGNEKLIWPGGSLKYAVPVKCDVKAAVAAIEDWYSAQDLSQVRAKAVYDLVRNSAVELAAYGEDSSANELLDSSLFGQLLEKQDEMREGDVEISYYSKPYIVPVSVGRCLADLIHNMLVIEYRRMLRRTAGLFALLGTYDAQYDEITRATGAFSFTDIQYLLAGSEGGSRLISRLKGPDRLYIDYRMDCSLDHWLLDEFQDTSDLQWSVFENMISEIVQSGDPDRSFFYVGDVKQAIYRWRGGNHELFLNILNSFNEHTSVIEMEPRQTTFRCSQPVIDAVNRTFAELPEEFPSKTIKEWSEVWKEHQTVAGNRDTGYVTILEPGSDGSGMKPEEQRCQLVADLLNEMQPVKRGLSVGVLVRGNDFGKELVNILCRECEGMNFVHEGESGIAENEVAQLLLSMIRAAAHPGDEFAWQYIMMTPMREVLQDSGIGKGNISTCLISEIQTEGFQAFVRKWGSNLSAVCDLGDYGMDCLDRFESASAEFDAMGQGDCNSFLNFMDSYTVREQPSSKAVRVMTVHQSKGLEFDVVILPQLQSGGSDSNMLKTSTPQLICAGGRSEPEWILRRPKKVICENDPVLKAEVEEENAAHCFDSLCVLYVAMTRAKHGLYMVTSGYKSVPKTMHASVFLKTQLTGEGHHPKAEPNISINGNEYIQLYKHSGCNDDWYAGSWPVGEVKEEPVETVTLSDGYAQNQERCKVLRHREPSKQAAISRSAGSLFEALNTDVMDFGSAIHEMFEQVEWAGNADVEKIIREWEVLSRYDADVTRDAITQFRSCMEPGLVYDLLSKPAGNTDAPWREKRFEVVLDGGIVSGAFDRVIVVRDDNGRPISANIIDYKSSLADTDAKIEKKAEAYRPQMETYRDALSIILGLDKSDIKLSLLFTRQQHVVSI